MTYEKENLQKTKMQQKKRNVSILAQKKVQCTGLFFFSNTIVKLYEISNKINATHTN